MKKLVLGALVASATMTGFVSEAFAGSKTLALPTHFQEQSQWCWNASSNMILRFYEKHFTDQCEFAEDARRIDSGYFGNLGCCLNPLGGSPSCNQPNTFSTTGAGTAALLNLYGVGVSYVGPITYAASKAEIDANHPFMMAWGWDGGGGHALVVKGYADASGSAADRLVYVDPWDDGVVTADYSAVFGCASGCGHNWWGTISTTAPGSSDNKASLYASASYGGTLTTVTSSVADLAANSNTTSSAKVRGVPYIFFDATNYGTPAWSVTPRDYPSTTSWGEATDNQISSVLKMPSSTERIAIVLFSGQNFTGSQVTLTADTPTMPAGWDNGVSSLIVVGKVWQLYASSNYGGNPYAVTSYGGPNRDGFYPTPSAWGGPDNDASSARYLDATAQPLLNPIVLFQNTDMTGRAVVLWDGGPGITDLSTLGFDNTVSSMRTYGGTWTTYDSANKTGTSHPLHPNRWYRTATDWSGADNAISSLGYSSAGGWRG